MIDIRDTDPDTGYSVAGHLVDELRSAGDEGLSAAELAHLVGEPRTQRIAAWLRELRAAGRVCKSKVSPGSTRVRWYAWDWREDVRT